MQIDLGIIIGLFVLAAYGFLSWRLGMRRGVQEFGRLMIEMGFFRDDAELYIRVLKHVQTRK